VSLARRTRPLRVALGAIVLASPLALTLGVRSGRLTPVPPLAEGDVWGLVTSLLALLARAASWCDHAAGRLAGWAGLVADPDPVEVAHARAHVRGRPDLRVVGGAA